MAYTKQTWQDNNSSYPLSAERMQHLEDGVSNTPSDTLGLQGLVALDSFDGSDDDAKLTAAMSYAAAQTFPPIIQLGNKSYSFSQARTPYDGFRIQGLGKLANSELSNVNMYTKVNLSPNGYWLSPGSSRVSNCYVGGIAFIGSSSTTFMGMDSGGLWFGLNVRDVSFHGFKSVLGTQAQKMGLSCCLFNGWWQIQGNYNGAIHIGGSDSRLWTDGCLVDASVSYNTAGNAVGQSHFWFNFMDNSTIGPLYITAEGPWGAIQVDGPDYNSQANPSNRGSLVIYGAAIEGRNQNQPCYGALVRINGGFLKLRDCYIGRCMSDPASMNRTPTDAGYVHLTGGGVLLDGTSWDRAANQSESVPVVYNDGGHARVINSDVQTKGGLWTGLPQVKSVSGNLTSDDTITVQ